MHKLTAGRVRPDVADGAGAHDAGMLQLSRWSGEFSDPGLEREFRSEYAADSQRHARAVLLWAGGLYLLVLLNDFTRLGWSMELLARVPLRLLVTATALFAAWRIAATLDTRTHDRWLGVFGLLVVASYTAINFITYTPGVIVQVSMVVLTLAAFVGLPAAFRWNAIVGGACVAVFTGTMVWFREASFIGMGIMLGFTALSSGLLVRRMNVLRRRAFHAWRGEREARDALTEAAAAFRELFTAAPVPFVLARTHDGQLLRANELALQVLQIRPAELPALHADDLVATDEDRTALKEMFARDRFVDRVAVRALRRDGSTFDVLVSARRVRCDGESCVLIGFTDVSELKRLERELYHQAAVDMLTGLANRRSFLDQLARAFAQARRQAQPLSVLYLDLDHFKLVNDRYGHAAGDEVLKSFADAVGQQVRAGDLVGRIGGEEFAVLLPDAGAAEAAEVAERIRAAVAGREIRTAAAQVPVTVSIGLASLGPEHGDPQRLLDDADAALYAAKQAGRNRVERAGRAGP